MNASLSPIQLLLLQAAEGSIAPQALAELLWSLKSQCSSSLHSICCSELADFYLDHGYAANVLPGYRDICLFSSLSWLLDGAQIHLQVRATEGLQSFLNSVHPEDPSFVTLADFGVSIPDDMQAVPERHRCIVLQRALNSIVIDPRSWHIRYFQFIIPRVHWLNDTDILAQRIFERASAEARKMRVVQFLTDRQIEADALELLTRVCLRLIGA